MTGPVLSQLRDDLKPFSFKMLDKKQNVMVSISPQDAEALLADHNHHNRNIAEASVRRWATAMTEGTWDPDASDLKVDWNGDLIDGQHRLLACIRSGVPMGTLLRTGLDPATQRRVDIGRRRNTSDTFRLEKIAWANNIAAAILLRLRYENGESRGLRVSSNLRVDLSPDQSLAYYREHPFHEKLASQSDAMYRIAPNVARTVWFAALPMFAERDEADALRFAESFVNGDWGGPGSPMQALIRYVSSARTPGIPGQKARAVNERHLLAIVKAWNAWRMDQPLERIKIAQDEPLVPVV